MYSQVFFTSLLTIAGLVAGAPLEQRSPGKAVVQNKCAFPVYLASVSGFVTPAPQKLAPGATWSENYRQDASGGGVSVKIAKGDNLATNPIEQLEYKVDTALWYDLSEINGHPFEGQKIVLQPSGGNGPSCVPVNSKTAYQRPDDTATKSCPLNTDLTLTLCA